MGRTTTRERFITEMELVKYLPLLTRLARVLWSSPWLPCWDRLAVWAEPPLENDVSLRLAELELVEFIPRLDSEMIPQIIRE